MDPSSFFVQKSELVKRTFILMIDVNERRMHHE